MSGISFATYPAQSQTTTATAPASDHTAVKEQGFQSAVAAQPAPLHANSTSHDPGPGLTTLAVGEEDGGGGGMTMAPEQGSMSTAYSDGDLQVTTLAIGEEDGGGAQFGYGSMSPIGDDHSMIGGGVQTDRVSSVGMEGLPEGYGTMQPIYSPGEAEYPAFAKTSETPDLLNFHPVARIPKTQLPHSVPVAAPPAPVYAPVTTQPMVMQATPVGALPQAAPVSGNYESIGSYEDYVRGLTGSTTAPTVEAAPMEMQPADTVYAPAEPVYDPVATTPTYEPVYEPVQTQPAAPVYEAADIPAAEPVYEAHQSPASTSVYEEMRPVETAPTYATSPAYEPAQAAPAEMAPVEAIPAETTAPVSESAPMTSAEPQEKPVPFEKDTPFDFKTDIEPADPADGNPDYVAPADAKAESAPAAKPEASYVNVPLDAYLVEPAGGATVGASEAASSEATKGESVKEAEAAPARDSAPDVATSVEPKALEPKSPETMSLGGSFIVMDQPLPDTLTGVSSGMGSAGPEASGTAEPASETPMPDTSGDELRIMTLAIGEEAGSP